MKELLIMRHAKSDWGQDSISDFERELSERGLDAAPKMGNYIFEKNLVPQLILSSPAIRAKRTVELFSEASHFEGKIEYNENFYFKDYGTYVDAIQLVSPEIENHSR